MCFSRPSQPKAPVNPAPYTTETSHTAVTQQVRPDPNATAAAAPPGEDPATPTGRVNRQVSPRARSGVAGPM
jgi:hypothetical protein